MQAVYCPNCGKEVEADDRFCKYCSYNLSESVPGNDGVRKSGVVREDPRSTGLAMIMSIILPGLGAYYIDGNTTGLVVFLVSLVLLIGTCLLPFVFLLTGIIMLVLWVYGLKLTSDSINSYRQKYPL